MNSGPSDNMRVLAYPAFPRGNAYNRLLYGALRKLGITVEEFTPVAVLSGKYNIIHLHWPEAALNNKLALRAWAEPFSLLRRIDWARLRGSRIVWSVHNLRAHEGLHPRLERTFWKAFIPKLDGYFSLSRSGQEAACERFPQLGSIPGFVVPHGHYRDAYPNRIGKSQARSELGIPPTARVFTFVGQVRPYKNVPLLIHSFRELQDSHALLLVVGRIRGEQLEQEVTKAAEGDPRVRLKLSYIPDDELQLYLNAADLVVLPFEEILNSGSALLALSFDRPIFVPYKGALVELRDIVGSEWVKTFEGEPTAKSLSDAMEWALHTPRGKMAPLERFDWNHIAVQTLHGYRMIIAGNEAPGQERQSSPVARENA